jgi:hypothetical protein
MNGGGADFDYSGGNLKFGTGKYQQRENDGYTGGVNLSTNGRSMQHNVYTGGRDARYGAYGQSSPMYDDVMMVDDDDLYDDMMMYGGADDMMMYGTGGAMGGDMMMYDMDLGYYNDQRRRGGGVFRDESYERAGRGGPRAYSNSRNGGYTVNGRSHQFNSRMDERRRYNDDFYYGDDQYFAARYGGGVGPGDYYDYDDEYGPGAMGGGGGRRSGPSGLIRDMF